MEFKKLLRRRQRERYKTIGFNEKTNALHCVIDFGIFLRRTPRNNNIKMTKENVNI